MSQRRERFRAWLAGDRVVWGAHVWDAISARVADDLDFELGFLTAHNVEWVVSGAGELSRATLTEYADLARRIFRTSSLSLAIVGPFGFGNALNWMRAVEEFENAGVSCVFIPDQTLPLPFGSVPENPDRGPRVSVEEAVGRIEAALAARHELGMVIGARVAGRATGDVDEIVRRVKAYEAAGVEAIWPSMNRPGGHASRTVAADDREDPFWQYLEALHAATNLPIIVGAGVFHNRIITDSELQLFLIENGVRAASLGGMPFEVMVTALYDALKALRDGEKTQHALRDTNVARDDFARVTRIAEDDELMRRFLT